MKGKILMTTKPATKQIECYRCNGTGYYQWMTYAGRLDGGACFRCEGTGIDPNPAHAERVTKRTAEQKARHEAQIAEIKERKAAAEAQAEIDNELRWAKEAYRDLNREIAKEEAAGNASTVNMYREVFLPAVMERLGKAVALNYPE